MIESRGAFQSVFGYGRFCELQEAIDSSPTNKWCGVLLNFVLDFETERRDVRQIRIQRLLVRLVSLLEFLEDAPIEGCFIEARNKWNVASYLPELSNWLCKVPRNCGGTSLQKPGAPEAAGRISGALTPKRRWAR